MNAVTVTISADLKDHGLSVAVVQANLSLSAAVSTAVPDALPLLLAEIRAEGIPPWPSGLRETVRDLLRHGRYKPTGRGKPASEFLLRAALEDRFPGLNAPANVNNWISLASGMPSSIFDAAVLGESLLLRRGLPGEQYVFNPSGQIIELEDLLCVCRRTESGWTPTGNPVKDAMISKIRPDTRAVLAVLYAPAQIAEHNLIRWAELFADGLKGTAGAICTTWRIY